MTPLDDAPIPLVDKSEDARSESDQVAATNGVHDTLGEAPIPLIDPSELPRPPADPYYASLLERTERILSGEIYRHDYLVITPQVERAVERDLADAVARCGGGEIPEELKARQLQQRLLSFHHAGNTVCYLNDTHGVIVITKELHYIGRLVQAFAGRWPEPPSVETPDEFV